MDAKQGSKRGRENERKELGKRPGNIAFKEVPKQKKKGVAGDINRNKQRGFSAFTKKEF